MQHPPFANDLINYMRKRIESRAKVKDDENEDLDVENDDDTLVDSPW